MELVEEARVRRIAISQGARVDSWVGELIPPHPEGTVICPLCKVTGRAELTGIEPDEFICYCGMLIISHFSDTPMILPLNHDTCPLFQP